MSGDRDGETGEPIEPVEPGEVTELTAELNLEPVLFIARTDAVLRMGAMMLGAGASSARVRDTMTRTAKALGIERLESRVGMTDIIVTAHRGALFRTRVAEIRRPGVNAQRIALLKNLSHDIEGGVRVEVLQRDLDRIESTPPLYSMTLRVASAAAACAAFAFLNNGGWPEIVSVALAVAAGQWVRILCARARFNEFLLVFLAALTALLGFLAVSHVLSLAGAPEIAYGAALTSSVLFLVPGFPLVTGALDLARLDLNAGVMRVVYACLILLACGSAVWAVAAVFETSATDTLSPVVPEPLLSVVRLGAGFIGVLGFAILFATPMRIALTAAVIGAVANVGRLTLVDSGVMPAVAAAAAGLAVGLGAYVATKLIRAPRIALTVPAVIIMVPGAASYRAIVATIDGDTVAAVEFGILAVFIVIALAVGLTVARVVTEREWGTDG